MRQVDLGIDLCCGKGAVAEELLDRSKVHSRLQKMGVECVTQRVRVEMIEIRSVADGVVELTADGPITEATAALVDEQRLTLVSDTSTPMGAFGKIGFEGLRCWPAERNEAFFAPFAAHPSRHDDSSSAESSHLSVGGFVTVYAPRSVASTSFPDFAKLVRCTRSGAPNDRG